MSFFIRAFSLIFILLSQLLFSASFLNANTTINTENEYWILGSPADIDTMILKAGLEKHQAVSTLDSKVPVREIDGILREMAMLTQQNGRSLKILLFGTLQKDPFTEAFNWIPVTLGGNTVSGDQQSGFPVSRLLRYLSFADENFKIHLFVTSDVKVADLESSDLLMDNIDIGGAIIDLSENPHHLGMLESVVLGFFKDKTPDEIYSSALGVGNTWISASDGKFQRRVATRELNSNSTPSNNETKSDDTSASETERLGAGMDPEGQGPVVAYSVSFCQNGPVFDGHLSNALELQLSEGKTTKFAVNQWGYEYSQQRSPVKLSLKDSKLKDNLSSDAKVTPASIRSGAVWVFFNNLQHSTPILNLFEQVVEIRPENDSHGTKRFVVAIDGENSQCEVVPEVWNLVTLTVSGQLTFSSINRVYPHMVLPENDWKPKYDLKKYESETVMNRLTSPSVILDSFRFYSTPLSSDELRVLSDERYHRFSKSKMVYSDIQELEKGIRRETEGRYHLADWDNIVACFRGEGKRFAKHYDLGMVDGYFVHRAGERYWGDSRHYFFGNHNQDPRETFLFHDQFENYLIGVGSWSRLFLRAFIEKTEP